MTFNSMAGMVSKPNRITQEVCTEPIQKEEEGKERESWRAGLYPKRSEMWASMCP